MDELLTKLKTESQEVFKKYTGIFAISTKGVIGYEVYKKTINKKEKT